MQPIRSRRVPSPRPAPDATGAPRWVGVDDLLTALEQREAAQSARRAWRPPAPVPFPPTEPTYAFLERMTLPDELTSGTATRTEEDG